MSALADRLSPACRLLDGPQHSEGSSSAIREKSLKGSFAICKGDALKIALAAGLLPAIVFVFSRVHG